MKKAPGRGLLYVDYGHARVADFSDAKLFEYPFDWRPTIEFCVFLEETLCRGKQEVNVVSLSGAELKYMVMKNVILKLSWIRDLLTKIDFPPKYPMRLYDDDNTVIHIT